MRVSKLMIVLGLTAVYLLFTLAFPADAFIDYDPNSTFAAQLMRRRMEGSGPLVNPAYNKENVNKPFIASDAGPALIRQALCQGGECFYRYSRDNIARINDIDVLGGPGDTRYNTDSVTRVFSPSTYTQPKFNYQPDYVYVRDNLPQLYSTIILGPVVIVLCYILFGNVNRE
jgi:hypothetical protein